MVESTSTDSEPGFIGGIINEIIYSPLNLLLVSLIAFLIYKIIKSRSDSGIPNIPPEPELPKLRKDFTVQELKKYDGNQPDGRVLVAVNGHVYDVRIRSTPTQCQLYHFPFLQLLSVTYDFQMP